MAFIFGGAIIGENVSLAMVVSIAGSSIISKFYLINGILLFLLPVLFFNNVDRVNRGKLLSFILAFTAGLLILYVCSFSLVKHLGSGSQLPSILLWLIYPISYLSKTIIFLTFWTLANDICLTNEAKQRFPRVAAWGFVGGLSGACIARVILDIASAEMLLVLWATAYIVAFLLARIVTTSFSERLRPHEQFTAEPLRGGGSLFKSVEDVLSIDLVRLISVLYFFTFIAVFTLDFLFWNRCYSAYPAIKSLASFQFTFFIIHSIATIIGLRGFMPKLIEKLGFPRIFVLCPISLFAGSLLLIAAENSSLSDTLCLRMPSRLSTRCFLHQSQWKNAVAQKPCLKESLNRPLFSFQE
jgi:hypothetical protein